MLWFTFIFTPLGPNVRVLKLFISDIGDVDEELYSAKFARNTASVIEWGDVESIYDLARYDPDLPDLIKVSGKVKVILSKLE